MRYIFAVAIVLALAACGSQTLLATFTNTDGSHAVTFSLTQQTTVDVKGYAKQDTSGDAPGTCAFVVSITSDSGTTDNVTLGPSPVDQQLVLGAGNWTVNSASTIQDPINGPHQPGATFDNVVSCNENAVKAQVFG